MNAPATITLDPRQAVAIARAKTLATCAAQYAADLERSNGQHTPSVQQSLLSLCNAAIEAVDDGDFLIEREHVMHDLGCDAEGYPVDCEGNRMESPVCILHADGSHDWREGR